VGALAIQDGTTSHNWEADLMQAAYFLERLGYLRFDAEASRAKLYVDLQRMVNAGEQTRATPASQSAPTCSPAFVDLHRASGIGPPVSDS
jgi:hypothetical protein